MTTYFFFDPSLLLLFLDPRSRIRDPGSEIQDPGWVKIRIRDKHPGSATLVQGSGSFCFEFFKRPFNSVWRRFQCCGSGSGIPCFYDSWIQIRIRYIQTPDLTLIFRELSYKFWG
jgi:hypothetical protein